MKIKKTIQKQENEETISVEKFLSDIDGRVLFLDLKSNVSIRISKGSAIYYLERDFIISTMDCTYQQIKSIDENK